RVLTAPRVLTALQALPAPSRPQAPEEDAMLYLDTAATAPVRREALEAAWPYLTGTFGNPSSHHAVGEAAAAGLEDARRRGAAVTSCSPPAAPRPRTSP